MKPRLAYVTSHPIQYQAPLFRRITERGNVELKVFFASDQGLRATHDPGFGQAVKWDVPLLEGYEHEFVPNYARRQGTSHFFGLVNPGIGAALAKWSPDVVVVHGYAHLTQLLTMLACKLRGVPVLLRGESNLLPQRPTWVERAKELAAPAVRQLLSGVVAIGTHNRAYFRHYGFAEEQIHFAPYVVDNDFFRADEARAFERARAWRGELGIGPDELVVGYAAKLIPVKGCDTLIEAFGRAAIPNGALVIVGDGPLRGELEALAARFPDAKIRFTGFANQLTMPAAYAMSDVFVLPSRFEPWGLAINEAMCLGRPVIVSDQVGCAPDLVGQDDGWVFPAGDVDALRTVLMEALCDREALGSRGKAATRRIDDWGLDEAAEGFERAAVAVTSARWMARGARHDG